MFHKSKEEIARQSSYQNSSTWAYQTRVDDGADDDDDVNYAKMRWVLNFIYRTKLPRL